MITKADLQKRKTAKHVLLSVVCVGVLCPALTIAQIKGDSELERAKSHPKVQQQLKSEQLQFHLIDSIFTTLSFDPTTDKEALVIEDIVNGLMDAAGLNSRARMEREALQEMWDNRAIQLYREIQESELQAEMDIKLRNMLAESYVQMDRKYQNLPASLDKGGAESASEQLQAATLTIEERRAAEALQGNSALMAMHAQQQQLQGQLRQIRKPRPTIAPGQTAGPSTSYGPILNDKKSPFPYADRKPCPLPRFSACAVQ